MSVTVLKTEDGVYVVYSNGAKVFTKKDIDTIELLEILQKLTNNVVRVKAIQTGVDDKGQNKDPDGLASLPHALPKQYA